ncbi:MAG: hypothetical protein ACI9OJ_003952, partial [Myxococcota bacterium]
KLGEREMVVGTTPGRRTIVPLKNATEAQLAERARWLETDSTVPQRKK